MWTRREFIQTLALTAGCSLLPLGTRGWAFAAAEPVDKHMVVVLLRGAVDGLSIVVPYTESAYYSHRPTIAIARPGQEDGALDLDGMFGLHPSLSSMMPLWSDKTLAFVHASGSPAPTRSHFEAQDIMETASPGNYAVPQGWMNTLIQLLPDNRSSTRALSFGNVLPRIFEGKFNVASVPGGIKGGQPMKPENPRVQQAFDTLYQEHPELKALYQEGMSSRASLISDLSQEPEPSMQMPGDSGAISKEMEESGKGAPKPDGFVIECQKLAVMMQHDPTIQLAFMDVGGWDTHINQGNAKGQLANRLEKLGEALAALANGLGDKYKNTAILVMSEFGRTVAENGNQGTDHGHGNVMWVMGGGVRGGKVWGRWPGLAPQQLYEGRDLAVTTDFRSVIGATLSGHFGLDTPRIAQVLAGYRPDSALKGII